MNRQSCRHIDAQTDLTEVNTYMYLHTQMVNMEKHSLMAIHFDNFQYYGGGLYMIQKVKIKKVKVKIVTWTLW